MAAKRRRSSTSSNKIYSREDMEIFDLLEYPVWVYDIDEKVMFWANESALELWNVKSLETLLSRCYSCGDNNNNMSYLTQRKLNECMVKFQMGETVREQRTVFDPQEGIVAPIHLIMSGIQVNTSSGPRMLMLVEANREDITPTSSSSLTEYTIGMGQEEEEETKKKEAQLTAAALARHELRTPLHQMIGFIELLSQTDMTDQQMEYVSPMQSASRSLMNVLEEGCDNTLGGGTGTSTATTTCTASSSSLDTLPPPEEAATAAPEEEPSADTKPARSTEEQESGTPHEGLEILVAEDSKLNQKLVKAMLQRMGHKVTLADDGALAVEQIETNKPNRFDVILMDKDMPVMGGIEATKLLRSKGYKIPIVGFTATYRTSEKHFYEESGMNDCIAKPARPSTLRKVLDAVVSKQRNLVDSEIGPRESQTNSKPKNTLFKSVSLCTFGDKKRIGYQESSPASTAKSPSSWERKGLCLGRSSSWASIPAGMTSHPARTLSPPRLEFARLA